MALATLCSFHSFLLLPLRAHGLKGSHQSPCCLNSRVAFALRAFRTNSAFLFAETTVCTWLVRTLIAPNHHFRISHVSRIAASIHLRWSGFRIKGLVLKCC